MTIQEMLSMPVGMTTDEWKNELLRRKKVEKKIGKLSNDIDFETDALNLLHDEMGSDRWMKHNNRLYSLVAKRDALIKEASEWTRL